MQIYLIKISMSFVSFVCFQTVKLIPNKVSKIKNKGCIPQRLKSSGYSNVILIKVQWNTIEVSQLWHDHDFLKSVQSCLT